MKKIFAILGTAFLAAAVLTGCSNSAGGNDGKKLTPEQQELGTKFNAVLEANNDASKKLSLATQKAANGGLQQDDINSAKSAVTAIKPKVEDLKTKAKEYLNKKGKTTEAAKVETVCTTYTNALDQVVTLLTEAAGDPSNKQAQLSQAAMKFSTAYQQFGQEVHKLKALFQ